MSFELKFEVRDYECDLQGIVNNSVYQNYLEHARHQFLKSAGLDFAEMHIQGIDAVVIRVELDYKLSLKSGDEFVVKLSCSMKGGLRIVFDQQIYRLSDKKLILNGKVFTVLTRKGKPIAPPTDFLKKLNLG